MPLIIQLHKLILDQSINLYQQTMGVSCGRQSDSVVEIASQRLRLKKVISKGDYGSIYLAINSDRCPIAVKYALKSFQKQIQALEIIGNHDNIVSIYGTQQKKEAGFILMQLAKMNIWQMISQTMNNHITQNQVIYILRQIATGLQHIHSKKCAHRSIKAQNILLMEDGRVKICDFGKYLKDQDTDFKQMLTAETENPERSVRKSRRSLSKGYMIDQKMDMWMFGCIAYILAFYKAPFKNIQQDKLLATQIKLPENSDVSAPLKKFLEMLLIPDHRQRMTADEALAYLNSQFVLQC